MSKYFGTDGIRLHAADFSFNFLLAVVEGLISYHGNANFSLLIGGDTRGSTANILRDLEAIASIKGIRCINIGVFPTPGINFYLGHSGLDYAIDVTASHNPATYNGLKIFELKDGKSTKLSAPGRDQIEQQLEHIPSGQPTIPSQIISENRQAEALGAYTNHLRDYLGDCDFSGQHIVLDCANGSTSVLAGRLFNEFGAQCEVINADQNFGTAINDNCGSTHLEQLISTVTNGHFSFGAAFDGDGDRCLLVTSSGSVVDGDKILAILAEYLELRSMVVTVMAGQGLFDWASRHGIALEVTDVGDQNVYARMEEKGLRLGGEQSGHIILPFEPMGDGMLTALMLTKIISERGVTLGELASAIPTFPQITINIPATAQQKANLSSPKALAVIGKFNEFMSSQNGRLLVRPSGTEDLIRITMWGSEDMNLEALSAQLAKELQEAL